MGDKRRTEARMMLRSRVWGPPTGTPAHWPQVQEAEQYSTPSPSISSHFLEDRAPIKMTIRKTNIHQAFAKCQLKFSHSCTS